jgi:hypothetical protein
MSIFKSKSQISSYGINYTLVDPTGNRSEYQVNMDKSWNESTTGRRGELFNVGGGSVYNSYPVKQFGFGSHVLTPKQNFVGLVHMWGAGGGAYHNSPNTRFAAGGGYSQAIVRFIANTPYTLVVGEAGNHNNLATHGGGGRGHSAGGSGGGLSGIFMNTEHTGTASWGHGTPPVSQANALVISGGGGGGGHHNQNSHNGNSGAGGGWTGKRAHTGSPGTQTAGGNPGYSNAGAGSALHGGHSGSNTSWLGGGGGGWFGGGGGGHSGNHHDGGNGGSGHIAYPSNIVSQPNNQTNNDLSRFIIQGFMEKGPGHFNNSENRPANALHPLNICEGRHAGMGGHGEGEVNHGPTFGSRHGKIVLTLMPEFYDKLQFPTHNQIENSSGWTQDY